MTEIQDDEESLIPKETKKVVKMNEKLKIVEFIVRLVLVVLSKFWKLCTSAGLILLLVFWYYGGPLTFILLLIGGFGRYYIIYFICMYLHTINLQNYSLAVNNLQIQYTHCIVVSVRLVEAENLD